MEDTLDPHMRITGGFIDLSTQPLHLCSWNHGKALKTAVGIAAHKWRKWGQFQCIMEPALSPSFEIIIEP